jgi:hypothetical protein
MIGGDPAIIDASSGTEVLFISFLARFVVSLRIEISYEHCPPAQRRTLVG